MPKTNLRTQVETSSLANDVGRRTRDVEEHFERRQDGLDARPLRRRHAVDKVERRVGQKRLQRQNFVTLDLE